MSDRLFLLCTNVVLALVRGKALATHIDSTFGLRASKVRPMISVVTPAELHVLARLNNWGANRLAALQNALDNLVKVDVNHPDVLDCYVEIDVYSHRFPGGARGMGRTTSGSRRAQRLGATLPPPTATFHAMIRTFVRQYIDLTRQSLDESMSLTRVRRPGDGTCGAFSGVSREQQAPAPGAPPDMRVCLRLVA
jgi:hypothetical protein